MLVFLLACSIEPASVALPGPYHDDPPVITAVAWACDEKTSLWTIAVDTEHWTGGGYFYLGHDTPSIERHALLSVAAAADGSSDHLELELTMVADFRDADPGTSTGFLCSEQDSLSYLVSVKLPDGSDRADCRTWGVDPAIFDTEDIGICEVPLGDTGT